MSDEPKADWFSVSTRLLRDRKVQVLIRRHGHEVSSIIFALFAQARLQKKAGEVDITLYDLAHDSLTTEEKAGEVLTSADELGFLSIDERDEIGVILHFPAWKRHQNTASQQRSREARKATTQADVIDGHQLSSDVVLQDKTRQDKTEKKEKKASGKPSEFDSWLTHYRETTGKPSVTGSKPARSAFAARVREGYSLADLKLATVGCHGDDFCRTNLHTVP